MSAAVSAATRGQCSIEVHTGVASRKGTPLCRDSREPLKHIPVLPFSWRKNAVGEVQFDVGKKDLGYG